MSNSRELIGVQVLCSPVELLPHIGASQISKDPVWVRFCGPKWLPCITQLGATHWWWMRWDTTSQCNLGLSAPGTKMWPHRPMVVQMGNGCWQRDFLSGPLWPSKSRKCFNSLSANGAGTCCAHARVSLLWLDTGMEECLMGVRESYSPALTCLGGQKNCSPHGFQQASIPQISFSSV